MPKTYRLNNKKLIEKCAISGKKLQSKYFIIKSLNSNTKEFAIVVSKKVDKRASVRNKIRRQVKYALTKKISNIENMTYLVVIKPNIVGNSYKEIEKDLLQNF